IPMPMEQLQPQPRGFWGALLVAGALVFDSVGCTGKIDQSSMDSSATTSITKAEDPCETPGANNRFEKCQANCEQSGKKCTCHKIRGEDGCRIGPDQSSSTTAQ